MKITCPYCRSKFNDYEEKCPNCGAPNEGVVRTHSSQPLTIDELRRWYDDRGLPPYETTRFFIGVNYTQPKAFGIYHDADRDVYVVYKNKADGQRIVRYEGTDEAYAVNELYQRLKEEIIEQKNKNAERGNVRRPFQGSKTASDLSAADEKKINEKLKKYSTIFFIAIVVIAIAIELLTTGSEAGHTTAPAGYYHSSDYYEYGDPAYEDYESDNRDSTNESYEWDEAFDDDDWDNDYDDSSFDFDFGGWDSGGGWDSDW